MAYPKIRIFEDSYFGYGQDSDQDQGKGQDHENERTIAFLVDAAKRGKARRASEGNYLSLRDVSPTSPNSLWFILKSEYSSFGYGQDPDQDQDKDQDHERTIAFLVDASKR